MAGAFAFVEPLRAGRERRILSASRRGTKMARQGGKMICARCNLNALIERPGGLKEASCRKCAAWFIPQGSVDLILREEQGITVETLRALAAVHGGKRLSCPNCDAGMSPI